MVNHNVVRGFAKLMRSNYDVWSAHMEAYLQQQGLWDVVTSNCPTNTKYWRAKEERVCQLLKDSIEDKELLQSIQNTMTPKGVWFLCWKMCSRDVKTNNNVSTQDIDGACNQVVHKKDDTLQRNIVLVHPNFLKTLNQLHASWIFGAIAELVDNASDAKATRLDIAVENFYFAKEGKEIPVLAFVDNGHGMSHLDVVRMFSFRCKQTHEGNADRIGRFGIGFKAGTMRLGRDVLVLTQTYNSRSVALFSQLYNEKKEEVESPIITYTRHGHMIVDLDVQSEELSNIYMKAITEFSPFNELDIKELFKSIDENETGTLIYIWNLDKGESDYTLQWDTTTTIGGTSHQIEGDIQIRSRRRRSRLGQKNSKVSLDYSLQAYLEVFFLNPRMKIYVQDSLVKCRPLAKFLNRTITYEGQIMGKPIKLTLGRSQEAWEQTNSGIFLYWHGRLIEAYKKGPIILGDTRCGMIGVIDVTNIMDDGNKNVWILNNKQGFHDCNAYCELVQWLECRETEYWKQNYISVFLGNPYLKPDNEWVQCSNCHEWRMLSTSSEPEPWCMLSTNSDVEALPELWFCSMPPFDGRCETPMRNAVMNSKTVPILRELRAKFLRKHSGGQHFKNG